MTTASEQLRALAERIAAANVEHTHPVAILLTGSAAQGVADVYSDIDLLLYYDEIPDDTALERTRTDLGATHFRWLVPRTDDFVAEAYRLDGVECQVAHGTIASWERTVDKVRGGSEIATPSHKALSGMGYGVALYGHERVAAWQASICDVPEVLGEAMVEHYLGQIFPVWYFAASLPARDAAIWVRQMLVECAFGILGVLAGLNRRYYSAFQLKHMHAFVDSLSIKPPSLAERLAVLADGEQPRAIEEAETLVRDTLDLLRQHLPDVDTSILRYQPGERHQPWR